MTGVAGVWFGWHIDSSVVRYDAGVRRIGRYILNGLTVLSVALCSATALLWTCSAWREARLVTFTLKGEHCRAIAVGGKLVGAGGGGFLMFYASDRNKLRHAMARAGLEEVRFRFDFEGTKIVLS